jgi:uridine phosphorylase
LLLLEQDLLKRRGISMPLYADEAQQVLKWEKLSKRVTNLEIESCLVFKMASRMRLKQWK